MLFYELLGTQVKVQKIGYCLQKGHAIREGINFSKIVLLERSYVKLDG